MITGLKRKIKERDGKKKPAHEFIIDEFFILASKQVNTSKQIHSLMRYGIYGDTKRSIEIRMELLIKIMRGINIPEDETEDIIESLKKIGQLYPFKGLHDIPYTKLLVLIEELSENLH